LKDQHKLLQESNLTAAAAQSAYHISKEEQLAVIYENLTWLIWWFQIFEQFRSSDHWL